MYEPSVKVMREMYSQKRSLVLSEKWAIMIPTIQTMQILIRMK